MRQGERGCPTLKAAASAAQLATVQQRTSATHIRAFAKLQPVCSRPPFQACKANRWATLSLTGDLDARKRQALVDEFNSPAHPSFVLLLSSKAGGVSAAARRHGQGRWQMAGKQ